jgi:multisubunit Na+/H+ antiporter MnhB subunit
MATTSPRVKTVSYPVAVVLGVAMMVAVFVFMNWAFPRPLTHYCVEYRVMLMGALSSETRCERWSDGKTRVDLGL